MVPKPSKQIRKEMGSVKLGQPDTDRSGFVIPGKEGELGMSMEGHKRGLGQKGCSLETPAGEEKGVAIKASTPSS